MTTGTSGNGMPPRVVVLVRDRPRGGHVAAAPGGDAAVDLGEHRDRGERPGELDIVPVCHGCRW